MSAEKPRGDSSGGWPISDPDSLEKNTSKALAELFEAGVFDEIAKRLGEALTNAQPEISTGLYLGFTLELREFRLQRGSGKQRLRNLGHIVVLNDRFRPHIEVGITPSAIDDTTPCAACGGSGITITNPVPLDKLPPRPFGTVWRKLF